MKRTTREDLPVQQQDVAERLQGFDAYMEKLLKDWNAPGVGVGVVAGDTLVLAKGYGYRDFEKKLPVTPTTLFPIASNTKLFTAVAAGLLVEEGKLTEVTPVFWTGRDAKMVVERPTQKPGETHGPEAEDTYGGVQSAGGGGGDQRGADAE